MIAAYTQSHIPGPFAVAASGNYVAAISTLMRYSRLKLETGASAVGIVAYYNGRA